MNRLVLAIGMLAVMVGPASAQRFYRAASEPPIVAGEVSSNGTVILGTGFTAQRMSNGKYRIAFPKGPGDCRVVSVTDVGNTSDPPTGEVHEPGPCSRVFYVRFFLPGNGIPLDQTFQFVAIGT